MTEPSLPIPSSTWVTGPGGSVVQVGPRRWKSIELPRAQKPHARHTCKTCGEAGHIASNKKKHPKVEP